jgi:uncharacterized membrane protein (UPF0127 family)
VLLGRCLATENSWERLRGLLGRSALAPDEGLWIRPCTGVHTFFMKFEMDVAFLDRKGRVIKVVSRMKPWRHSAIYFFAAGALEAAGGALAGVREGEVLELCPSS